MIEVDDQQLETMRTELKRVLNPRARDVEKRGHEERNYDVISSIDESRRYRIYVRQSRFERAAFSAGLLRVFTSGQSLVLVRYNGPSHAHRNRIEHTRFGAMPHRHITKAVYIAQGMHPDGHAEPDPRFSDVDGALRCLLRDCNVIGLDLPNYQTDLF